MKYKPGKDLTGISMSIEDLEKAGIIVRDSDSVARWYVSEEFFENNDKSVQKESCNCYICSMGGDCNND